MTHILPGSTQFIETIRVSNGMIMLPHLHHQRMEATCRETFGSFHHPSPTTIPIPDKYSIGEVKLRIIYSRDEMQWEFIPYSRRPVHSLRIIEASPATDYHLKYADRTTLNRLHDLRDGCDEVLISISGKPCDTTYTNIILTDGKRLVTPSSCLLPGIMRRHLIESGKVAVLPLTNQDLRPGNRYGFTHLLMINAMMPPEAAPCIALENISFPAIYQKNKHIQ
ncbi:MAG: aminotransferase class IV [Muribaculaceae bacterium]|nr:aminotransferase class IV [Muribaculaceae bacterium]